MSTEEIYNTAPQFVLFLEYAETLYLTTERYEHNSGVLRSRGLEYVSSCADVSSASLHEQDFSVGPQHVRLCV